MQNSVKTLSKVELKNILSLRFEKNKTLSEIPNPSLLKNADKSALRIADAIRDKETIVLVGDYDVDGVSSSAIVLDFFKQIPYPLEVIIPNRFKDGYGISSNILEKIDADLIITVDNGITAVESATICKERGIDLIITDHHIAFDVLPDAYSIVNPKLLDCPYPFKEICGAQVAWLLLALVKKELKLNIDMKSFLDILAIAIIADIMPLVDINRAIVKEGLKMLNISKRPSSIVIKDFLDKSSIKSEDIAFQIAPRLNSAGRLKDASVALDFFTAPSITEAYEEFETLNKFNESRKEIEAQITQNAIDTVDTNDKIIVTWGDEWHEGIIGIVASRLIDKFQKPAIVLSIKDSLAKGSARSVGDINIYELIKQNKHLLIKFGGHKMAAGLSLNKDNLEEFKLQINKSVEIIKQEEFYINKNILGILNSQDIDLDLLDLLDSFEPYGEANQKPIFKFENAEVIDVKLMGADKSHSKIMIKQYPHHVKTLELIAFRTVYEIPKNRKITCSYTVSKNEFNGRVSVQLLLNKIF